MDFKVEVDNTEEILKALEEQSEKALEAVGLQASNYAKALAPVDTGRLRNSLTYELANGELAVLVGTNVEYAPYVEMGTRYTNAQPFLEPAIVDHKDEYKEIVKAALT